MADDDRSAERDRREDDDISEALNGRRVYDDANLESLRRNMATTILGVRSQLRRERERELAALDAKMEAMKNNLALGVGISLGDAASMARAKAAIDLSDRAVQRAADRDKEGVMGRVRSVALTVTAVVAATALFWPALKHWLDAIFAGAPHSP